MTRRRIVIATDLFLDHLEGGRTPSVLRVAAGMFFCYTTVFNALELFAVGRNARERKAVEDAMATVKVLGLNARSAPRYGALFRSHPGMDPLRLLMAGLCLESGLPVLTGRPSEFRRIRGLRCIPGSLVLDHDSAAAVFAAARRS